MKGCKFKNEEDGERQKLHEEIEKERKRNLKKEKKKKKKKAKVQAKPEQKDSTNPPTHSTPHKTPVNSSVPYEDEDILVGYGTNAMIYNNNMGDSESSEDEGIEDYKAGGYHAVHIGEVYLERYVILQKLGWGHFSTVWLAKDLQYGGYVALKIQKSAQHYLEAAFDEVEILEQVSTKWKNEDWKNSFVEYENKSEVNSDSCHCIQLLNSFVHFGPNGRHFVMVFEILGVNLLEIIKRYNYRGVPLPLVRIISRQVLLGLDYLHRVCKIIHTDLKPENVLLCLTREELGDIITQGQFGKAKSEYKYGATPLLSEVAYKNGNKKETERKPEMKEEGSRKESLALTEEDKKELKKQKKRDKKKRLKKKKQAAKAEIKKAEQENMLEKNETANHDAEANKEECNKKAENDLPLGFNSAKRRLSDPIVSSPLVGAKVAWSEYEDLAKPEGGFTPNKKPLGFEEPSLQTKPFIDKGKKRGPRIDTGVRVKVVDLGNACWTYHHFTPQIQTRQYRSPEVIIGAEYGCSADIWSFACMVFELVTGDFLFEPRKGDTYDKNDDHLAQMIELLNQMPKTLALSGVHSKRYFTSSGSLRNIQGLHYWPLKKVLMEKYRFKELEAQGLTDFLLPMLEWDPQKRATAQQMLSHPWLKMPSVYDTKMKEKEYRHMTLLRKLNGMDEDEETGIGSSNGNVVLGESMDELCNADVENNEEEETSEDELEDLAESPNNKYGPNSSLLNIDHGPNPQFLDADEVTGE